MKKVITYGTYDLLHYGHIKLLERAKELGDYLIVGVTSDDYDKTRGKINNKQNLMERVVAVKATGIADEVIAEEYEGQKIDDIRRYGVDIFTVGSDWEGKFDYLKEYCQVVYLPRTEGVSSTEIRAEKNKLTIGLIGDSESDLTSLKKFTAEIAYVNGIHATCSNTRIDELEQITDYDKLLERVDSVYVVSHPRDHYSHVKRALQKGKHVLCETPIALERTQCEELFSLAKRAQCVLMEAAKTAYTTAFERLVLVAKTGKIGEVLDIDATCTRRRSIQNYSEKDIMRNWNTITEWGPLGLLPIFLILGCEYKDIRIVSRLLKNSKDYDIYTKIDLLYDKATASVKVAKGAKSEGELIITGTEGYIYVPAPWWKTDYFEVRFENQTNNRRYFYQLEGEGIRYEIVAFSKAIEAGHGDFYVSEKVSKAIAGVMEEYYKGTKVRKI
ncbi:adenylyltransferase/cytidyltransferase family protein [Lachnospiraceae bacterium 56-18]|uniref:adenylyltransferase/cytidyltransferase family protein n=1 Tax=Sporofaciens sp. JLR.KK001 TaxID=3112621 RepID=UPI002FEFCB0A